MASKTPRELLQGYVEVSSLPMIHLRLEEAINNPKKSMSDIAKIIRDDPGLSARLLRIVNSAFYSFPAQVETISQAVTIVGTQQLSALALATSVMKMFKGLPEDLVTMESFWRHSIGCGLVARLLGTCRRESNSERLFVAGMLHDIGRLVMFGKLGASLRDVFETARTQKRLLCETEQEILGFTHAAVGGVLLQTWKLPTSLEEVALFHHTPGSATRFPMEVATVHVADIIAHSMSLGTSGETFVPPLDTEAWERLNLSPSILASVEEQVDRQFQDAWQSLFVES